MLKEKNAVTIMDAACGTGVDSVMLIEEMGNNPGFHLTSCDFSDKMLKDALKTRWDRRREKPFFDWVIEEGNWLTLKKDVPVPGFGFDAIICMGNSFPNLMDEEGDLRNQKIAIKNFYDMLKPGGILIIDHRNYDYILKHGKSPNKNIYYNSSIYKVVTKTIYEDGKAKQIILDYRKKGEEDGNFLLHVQPYKLSEFSSLLKGVFGTQQQPATHKVFGDFKELKDNPDSLLSLPAIGVDDVVCQKLLISFIQVLVRVGVVGVLVRVALGWDLLLMLLLLLGLVLLLHNRHLIV